MWHHREYVGVRMSGWNIQSVRSRTRRFVVVASIFRPGRSVGFGSPEDATSVLGRDCQPTNQNSGNCVDYSGTAARCWLYSRAFNQFSADDGCEEVAAASSSSSHIYLNNLAINKNIRFFFISWNKSSTRPEMQKLKAGQGTIWTYYCTRKTSLHVIWSSTERERPVAACAWRSLCTTERSGICRTTLPIAQPPDSLPSRSPEIGKRKACRIWTRDSPRTSIRWGSCRLRTRNWPKSWANSSRRIGKEITKKKEMHQGKYNEEKNQAVKENATLQIRVTSLDEQLQKMKHKWVI